jgi:PKD domain
MRIRSFLWSLIIFALGQFSCQNDAPQQNNKNEIPTTSSVLPTATDRKVPTVSSDNAAPQGIPVAKFIINPTQGDKTTVFTFDASTSTGTIRKYRWKFGDGSFDQGKVVTHQYKSGGQFQVRLKVVSDTKDKDKKIKNLTVEGSGSDQGTPCKTPAPNRGFIFGTVVDVQGFNAIVQLPAGSTCANSYYHCGDMRRANPEQFRGIIHAMSDLGNGKFSIFNDCPFRWPPAIGETVFLYYKTCSQNFCP